MKQFDLQEYINNPQERIVTRDGKNVRIVCTDVKNGIQEQGIAPVLALIDRGPERGEDVFYYPENGKFNETGEHPLDLFFAGKNETVSRFENELKSIISTAMDYNSFSDLKPSPEEYTRYYLTTLLTIAKEEIEKEYRENHIHILTESEFVALTKDFYRQGYESCKQGYEAFKKEQSDSKNCSIVDDLKKYLSCTPKEQVKNVWNEIKEWCKECFPKENELAETEFDKLLMDFINEWSVYEPTDDAINYLRNKFKDKLLELARKETKHEFKKQLDAAYNSRDKVVYNEGYAAGKAEALKDLPKWKYNEMGAFGIGGSVQDLYLIRTSPGYYYLSSCVGPDTTYIELEEIEKLLNRK